MLSFWRHVHLESPDQPVHSFSEDLPLYLQLAILHLLIIFANSLDPDQDRQKFMKNLMFFLSQQTTKS